MGIRVNAALTQFNNGLVSPEIEARTDLQVAAHSCRRLENASVEVAGGVHRRGGSVYVPSRSAVTQNEGWSAWGELDFSSYSTAFWQNIQYNAVLNKFVSYYIGQYTNFATIYYLSNDGVGWTPYNFTPATDHNYDFMRMEVASDGTIFAYAHYLENNVAYYTAFYSMDGITWTKCYPADISVNNRAYYTLQNGTCIYNVYRTTNNRTSYPLYGYCTNTDRNVEENWTFVEIADLVASLGIASGFTSYNIQAQKIHQCGNQFVWPVLLYGSTSTEQNVKRVFFLKSTDGITWTYTQADSYYSVFYDFIEVATSSRLQYVHGKYFIWGSSSYELYSSSDLATWTRVTSYNPWTNPYITWVKGDNIFCLYMPSERTTRTAHYLTSADGVTWTEDSESSIFVAKVENDFLIGIDGSNNTYYKNYLGESVEINGTKALLVPFVVNRNIAYILEFGNYYVRFYRKHGQIIDPNTGYGIALQTPYSLNDLFDTTTGKRKLGYIQSADVMYLFHENHPVQKLSRTSDTSWALEAAAFKLGPWDNMNSDKEATITASETTGTVTLTASKNLFSANDVGRYIRIYVSNTNTRYWYVGASVSTAIDYKSDGKFYQAQSGGTAGNVTPTHTEGSASDGSIIWNYKHSGYGTAKIVAYASPTSVTAQVEETLPTLVKTTAQYQWQMSIAEYPKCGTFYKGRLLLGINTSSGPAVAFSQSNDYENFDDVEFGEVKATCGMKLPIDGDLSKIEWLSASGGSLYVGSVGGVTEVKPQSTSSAFGPENISYDKITNISSNSLQPILIGGSNLYIGGAGKSIHDLIYLNDNDMYDPQEVSQLAKTWLKKGVKDWALQYDPDRIVWCAMQDGTLMGLTYNNTQQVTAFHKHITNGKFISVAAIPSPDGQTDELWAVIERTLNNVSTYCVEYFRDGLPLDIPTNYTEEQTQTYRLKYAYYVDCGAQYTFETPQNEITGLDWLEGKQVAVLADGVVVRNKTISNGTLTLDNAASVVTVGLAYETFLEPLPVYVEGANGTGNARTQRINKVVMRLLNSGGFWYGEKESKLDYASLRRATETGDAVPLKSGDLRLNWNGNESHNDILGQEIPNATGARMMFKQSDPLPLRILAIYPQLEITND